MSTRPTRYLLSAQTDRRLRPTIRITPHGVIRRNEDVREHIYYPTSNPFSDRLIGEVELTVGLDAVCTRVKSFQELIQA